MKKANYLYTPALLLALASSPVVAEVNINGFASFVGGRTTGDDENYRGYRDELEFDKESLFAVQATSDMGDGLSAVVQILAKAEDDWDPEFEWAYMSWDINEQFNLKVGRLRIPFYFYSEYLDAAYTYHWIRPPLELYDLALSNYDGISASYTLYTGDFEHKFMLGYGKRDDFIDDFEASTYENMFAFNWDITYENYTIKLVHVIGDLTFRNQTIIDAGVLFGAAIPGYDLEHILIEEDETTYSAIAFNADWEDWFLVTEYAQVNLERDNIFLQDDERFMFSFGKRWDKFTAHYTYSAAEADDPSSLLQDIPDNPAFDPLRATVNAAFATNQDRTAHTFGLRYDFHPMAAFKVELTRSQNDATDQDTNVMRFAFDLVF